MALPVQYNYPQWISNSVSRSGVSYAGASISGLKEVAKILDDEKAVLCIKAFTKKGSAAYTTPFSDVKSGSWYGRAVYYAAGAHVFSGTSAATFDPQTPMTRAMFVQVLANLAGADLSEYTGYTGFSDVPKGKWYAPAVHWASVNNIVNGVAPDKFDPNGIVTRQQMCVMLVRYARAIGLNFTESTDSFRFADDNMIQNYARIAVYICKQYGIINGMTETEFAPRDGATRAQVAAMFMNFCQRYLY